MNENESFWYHNYQVVQGQLVEYYDRIQKAICFLNTEYNTYPSSEEWRKALIKILNGDDKE